MTIRVGWDNTDRTIVQIYFAEKWTWDEYHLALNEAYALARSVDHAVAVLVDGDQRLAVPSGSPITHISHAVKTMPDNVSVIVVVTINSFVRALISALMKMSSKARQRGAVVGTRDEAYATIASRRVQHGTNG